MRRWTRYAAAASLLTLVVVGAGWLLFAEEGRRGVLVAGGIALPLQLVLFGGLVRKPAGSPGFLAVWVGGSLLRLAAIAAAALWVAGVEEVDTLIALLALAGLLFVLLLLEPWALREKKRETDPRGRSGNES